MTGTRVATESSGEALRRWAPGLALIRSYPKSWLRPDLMAAVTVLAILIPQGIAYGSLAGVDPVVGLYAAMAAMVAYACFGSSGQVMVGPESGIAILAAASVTKLAAGAGPARYVAMISMLALLAGIFLVLGGLARVGFVANFLSKPLLLGYMNGVALIVIASQLGKLFGIKVGGDQFFPTIKDLVTHLEQTSVLTLSIGLVLIAFLLVMRRLLPHVPAALVAVVVTTALSAALGLSEHGVAVLGPVPSGLPRPQLPQVGLRDAYDLLPAALSVALVAFADGILTARLFADKHGYTIDANQEMFGLGAATIASGLFGAFPVGASNSRSAVNDDAGGRSQLVGVVAAALVAVFLLFFTALLKQLPVVTLAAIVIVAASGLLDVGGIMRLYRVLKVEAVLAAITFVSVLTFGILYGILVAVALSLLTVIARISRPHSAILGPEEGVDGFQEIDPDSGQTIPGLIAYRFDAPLFFANANYLLDQVRELVRRQSDVKWFLLDAEGIVNVDTTAVDVLKKLETELRERNVVLVIARANEPMRTTLRRGRFIEQIGDDRFYPTVRTAVEAYLAEPGGARPGHLQPTGEGRGHVLRAQSELQEPEDADIDRRL